jgi:alpha-glucosidase
VQARDDGSVLALCRRALEVRARLHLAGAVTADDRVSWQRTDDGRLVAERDGGFRLVLAMGDGAVPLPDGELLVASAPLTAEGLLPADGAAWLRPPAG